MIGSKSKNPWSFIACCIISLVLVQYRYAYSGANSNETLKVTSCDALGYYMYLPSAFIYNDATELKWFPRIDSVYQVSGGWIYQFNKGDNGKYVFKYLGGVAILELPFFFAGHALAKLFHYKADGFSPPYQYSIAFGTVLYCILALFLLRKVLLRFFDDSTTAITLLLVMLATNVIQYISADSGQSHGYIFPLYVLILYFTIKWHEKPTILAACAIGYIIGLATISRPTEAIILFIPLLWGLNNKETSRAKWNLVKSHRKHIFYAVLFAFLGVLPQLIYWHIATGHFVYDVGSKWVFLNPYFRVLFGWEKGWFIYTPVTLFFIAGMFFMKSYSFQKSVIWFCLLNIWIIISWDDWRYGASYSTRALVQSYPVFVLPMAAFVDYVGRKKWKYLFYLAGLYLIGVNLFQIVQYNRTILHYDWMNRQYYGRIYLNMHPTPLDMSALDSNEIISGEGKYKASVIAQTDSLNKIVVGENTNNLLLDVHLKPENVKEAWLKIEAAIKTDKGIDECYLGSEIDQGNSKKLNRVRLANPISGGGYMNNYVFETRLPDYTRPAELKLFLIHKNAVDCSVQHLKVSYLSK